jgi:hypothetical protein
MRLAPLRRGEFVTFYGKNYEAPQMAEAILEQMKRLRH